MSASHSRRMGVVIAIAVVSLVVLFVVTRSTDGTPARQQDAIESVTPTTALPTSGTDKASMPGSEVNRLQGGLTEGETSVYHSLWVAQVPPALSPGTTVKILDETYQVVGNYARVDARISTPAKGVKTQRMLLVKHHDSWKIFDIEEVK